MSDLKVFVARLIPIESYSRVPSSPCGDRSPAKVRTKVPAKVLDKVNVPSQAYGANRQEVGFSL